MLICIFLSARSITFIALKCFYLSFLIKTVFFQGSIMFTAKLRGRHRNSLKCPTSPGHSLSVKDTLADGAFVTVSETAPTRPPPEPLDGIGFILVSCVLWVWTNVL